jgi:methionine-gamma-lyase
MYGGISSPFDSWLLARSLRTLELRILKHSQNALSIAQFLDNHPKISKVYYSGLKSSPFYKTALKQFQGKGFGGMMSFNIKGADGKAENLIKNVKNIPFAPSLAGTATTLSHSAKASHRPYSKQEREALGITENQLRLSVGLEDADDIIQYLSEGLKQI